MNFEYDPASQKWEVIVRGAESEEEAKQGFNAVVLTIIHGNVDVGLRHKVQNLGDRGMKLDIAIRG